MKVGWCIYVTETCPHTSSDDGVLCCILYNRFNASFMVTLFV